MGYGAYRTGNSLVTGFANNKIDIIVGYPGSVPTDLGPKISGGHFFTTQDETPLVFSQTNGNQVSISDPDTDYVGMIIAARNGVLSVNGTEGLTMIIGDGSEDPVLGFTGTISDINNALNGMSFKPADNYSGVVASINFEVTDFGNSGM